MFDFGFSEVLLTSVIALIVLGPEKLPRAASQVGRWVGRARAMARQFREQLEEEVNLENVKKAHKEEEAKRESEAKRTGGSAQSGSSTEQNPTGYGGAGAGGPGTGHDTASGQTTGAAHDAASGQAASPGLPGSGQAHAEYGVDQADSPPMQPAAIPAAPFSSQISPDPSEFRADTFSHAHPTDEFGANPLTANGAAEPTPAATHDGSGSGQYPPAGAGAASPEASAASVSVAPHAPSARPDGSEAYASASTPVLEAPNTAHSTTPPEKSGPA